jgi:hypothetical protein
MLPCAALALVTFFSPVRALPLGFGPRPVPTSTPPASPGKGSANKTSSASRTTTTQQNKRNTRQHAYSKKANNVSGKPRKTGTNAPPGLFRVSFFLRPLASSLETFTEGGGGGTSWRGRDGSSCAAHTSAGWRAQRAPPARTRARPSAAGATTNAIDCAVFPLPPTSEASKELSVRDRAMPLPATTSIVGHTM